MSAGSVNYRNGIRAAIRGLWTGALFYDNFFQAMMTTIRNGLTAAWQEGSAACGIAPAEYTLEERIALEQAIVREYQYIGGLGHDVEANSKANGGKLTPLLNRGNMWINRYNDVVNHAKQAACKNQKLRWVLHLIRMTKDPCVDCLRLNGRVYRASTWNKWGIRPQSSDLACSGIQCGCGFEVTDEPANKGRPPKLSGQ